MRVVRAAQRIAISLPDACNTTCEVGEVGAEPVSVDKTVIRHFLSRT